MLFGLYKGYSQGVNYKTTVTSLIYANLL